MSADPPGQTWRNKRTVDIREVLNGDVYMS
jgi:hypothetical protein